MSTPLQSEKPLNAPGDDVLKAETVALDRGDADVVVVPLRSSPVPVMPVAVTTTVPTTTTPTFPTTLPTTASSGFGSDVTDVTTSPVASADMESDAPDNVTVTTTTTAAPYSMASEYPLDSEHHEKNLTEKMKDLVVDNARLAKEKTMGALHVAYEKIHDAGIAVEERAAAVLKHLGHVQMNKAEELEHDAARRRIEIDSQPQGPSVLDTAGLKLKEAGIALEKKTGQLLQGTGQTLQESTAPSLEQDAAQRRIEAEGKPTIFDTAGLKLKEAGIALEKKTGQLLQGTGQTLEGTAPSLEQDATQRRIEAEGKPTVFDTAGLKLKEAAIAIEKKTGQLLQGTGQTLEGTAPNLEQDATQRRIEAEGKPSMLETASNKIKEAGIAIEKKTGQLLQGTGQSLEGTAPNLEQDATQRRIEAEGKPSMLETASNKIKEAGIAVEAKAGQLLQGAGDTMTKGTAPNLEQDATQRRVDAREEEMRPKSPSLVDKAKAKLQEAGAAIQEKAGQVLEDTGIKQEPTTGTDLEQDTSFRRAPDASWYSRGKESDLGLLQPLASEHVIKEVPVMQASTAERIPVDTGVSTGSTLTSIPVPIATTTTTFPVSKATPPSTTTTSATSGGAQHVPFWDAPEFKKRTPSPYHSHVMDQPSSAGGAAGVTSPTQGAFDAFKKVSANVEEKAHRAFKGLSDMSYAHGADWSSGQGQGRISPSTGLASTSGDPLPKTVPPTEERKVIPDPVD